MGEEITLDLKDILFVIRKRLKMIIAVTLTMTILSGIISFFFLTPIYESKSSIVVGAVMTTSDEGKSSYEYSDVMMYQKLVKTFAKIATREDTAKEAIDEYEIKADPKREEYVRDLMDPSDFVKNLSVSPQADTQIIDIKVQNKDPEKAALMVEAIGESFMKRAKKTFPNVNIDVVDTAKVPVDPVKPNKKLNVMIAFFLGLMISVGITFLLEFLDGTVKSQEEVEKLLGIPVIGGIPSHNLDI